MSKKGKTIHERSCQSISFISKTDYLHLKISERMKVLVCENNSSVTSSRILMTDCLGKLFTGIQSADSVSEKITLEEQSPLISQKVVWSNYSEQMTEKQNSVKTCTKSLKRETPPIYGNRCSSDQRRKSCPKKQVWIG